MASYLIIAKKTSWNINTVKNSLKATKPVLIYGKPDNIATDGVTPFILDDRPPEMRLFGRARAAEPAAAVQTVPGGRGGAFSGALDRYQAAGMERKLYDTLRLTVPIIDAAVCKIVRLTGGVSVQCESRRAQEDLNRFLESVQVNACGTGIETFLGII